MNIENEFWNLFRWIPFMTALKVPDSNEALSRLAFIAERERHEHFPISKFSHVMRSVFFYCLCWNMLLYEADSIFASLVDNMLYFTVVNLEGYVKNKCREN